MSSFKKLLGIGQKIQPILMESVNPAPQDPIHEQRVTEAVGKMVGALVDLERRSYIIRKELATLSLTIVAGGQNAKPLTLQKPPTPRHARKLPDAI